MRVHPVGPMVYAGPIFYPAAVSRDLLRAFRSWATEPPDEITALVNLTTAPPLPVIPSEWHGKKVAALVAVSTVPDDGATLVHSLREVAEPIADLLGPMPYSFSDSLACTRRPSAVTTSAPTRLSDARPCLRISQPILRDDAEVAAAAAQPVFRLNQNIEPSNGGSA